MNFTSRVLPPDEWDRLAGTELGELLDLLCPDNARVVVVEDGPDIVGRWVATPVWHVEGVWISPKHRGKTSVARRLWAAMSRVMQSVGARAAWTGAENDEIAGLMEKRGAVRVPFAVFSLPFQEKR